MRTHGAVSYTHLVAEVERIANDAVIANVPVNVSFPDAEALEKLVYRSKKALKGDVRIVDVPGCDRCACCGVHVRSTGEICLLYTSAPETGAGR